MSEENKKAEIVTHDAIANYRTIASFGHDYKIVDLYINKLLGPRMKSNKDAILEGFLLGYSSFVFPGFMAYLFIVMALFGVKWAEKNNDIDAHGAEYMDLTMNSMLACLMILAAGNESGMAAAFAGDAKAATKAGITIFKIANVPSKVDTLEVPDDARTIEKESFRGEIEFKNVWFRYPTRTSEWVFKDMNLKISAG